MEQPNWRPRNFGARWQFAFFHALIRGGGRRVAYGFAALVSGCYVLLRPEVRHRCRPYLRHRFPTHGGFRRLWDTVRLTTNFACVLVDRAALALHGPQEFGTHLTGEQTLKELLEEGHGLILLTAHVGAWQLGLSNLKVLPAPVTLLARQEAEELYPPFQQASNAPPLFRLVDPTGFLGGIPELLCILQEGGSVCLMGDRVLGSGLGVVHVNFLGESLPLPYSPYKLASATGAPVAVLFPYKPSSDGCELRIAAVLRVPPDLGRNPEAYAPYAQLFANTLADFVQEFPYHCFNFYDLWQDSPPLPPSHST